MSRVLGKSRTEKKITHSRGQIDDSTVLLCIGLASGEVGEVLEEGLFFGKGARQVDEKKGRAIERERENRGERRDSLRTSSR